MAKCEDRYNKAKAVHSVLRHVADLRGLVLEDLSTKVSWPLYRKYGHAFDAFKLTLQDEEDVFVGLDMDEETKQVWDLTLFPLFATILNNADNHTHGT